MSTKPKQDKPSEEELKSALDIYTILVIASIFFDILFLVSIPTIMKRNKIAKALDEGYLPKKMENQYRIFDTLFWIFFAIRIFGVCVIILILGSIILN